MAEKNFDIMEKIYSEILSMKQDLSDIKQFQEKMQYDINGMKQEFMRVKLETTEIKQEIIGAKHAIKQVGNDIEEDIVPKIEAQFDEYKQNTEQIVVLEDKINDLDSKIDGLR